MTAGVVTLLSGGMDSTTLLWYLAVNHPTRPILALSFDYGQRHRHRELESAVRVVREAQARFGENRITYESIDLTSLTHLLEGSALTDRAVDVPEGHYADETMRKTVVPNRNMVMLSIGASVAIARKSEILAFACHAGDHPIYPDCRPSFVGALSLALHLGNEGYALPTFQLQAPFVNITKTEIARIGLGLRVPFELTWSCYKGEQTHCGVCGTCVERQESFRDLGERDPTEYKS